MATQNTPRASSMEPPLAAGRGKGVGSENGMDASRVPSLAQPSEVLEGRGLLSTGAQSDLESALRKVTRRIVPLTMAVAMMNHLDRSK